MSENNIKKRNNKDLIFFNEAIEYFDKFKNQENPFDQETNPIDTINCTGIHLRAQMLVELNNLKYLILDNPDSKFKALSENEKDFFYDFINYYSVCPICMNLNHYYNLKKLFFSDNKKILKEELIRFMKLRSKKLQKFNISIGIPCCNCFKRYF